MLLLSPDTESHVLVGSSDAKITAGHFYCLGAGGMVVKDGVVEHFILPGAVFAVRAQAQAVEHWIEAAGEFLQHSGSLEGILAAVKEMERHVLVAEMFEGSVSVVWKMGSVAEFVGEL